MTKYIVEITPLTGIHIGTGEEFGPLEYTIKEKMYYRFKDDNIVKLLNKDELDELYKLIDLNQLNDIASLFASKIDNYNTLYNFKVNSNISENFKKNKNKEENQLLVSETYRSKESYLPIIPGSSIKGAIRTAIISRYGMNLNKINNSKRPDSEILKYKDVKSDPFRAVHISDSLLIGKNINSIVQVSNFKNSGDEITKNNIQIIKEVVKGELLGGDTKGYLEIDIDDKLQKVNYEINKWKPLRQKFTLNEIIKSCNDFYKKHFYEEKDKFFDSKSYTKEASDRLADIIDKIDNKSNECLIRLGMFSQIENVTIDNHRKPWNKEGYGNTRMLIKDYYQGLGWVKLKFYKYENEGLKIKNKYDLYYFQYLEKMNNIKIKYQEKIETINQERLRYKNMSETERKALNEEKEKIIVQKRVESFKNNLNSKTFNFDSWQNNEILKNSTEIAQAILDLKLIKPKKSSGEFRKNFKILAQILNTNPEELLKEPKPDNNKSSNIEKSEVNKGNEVSDEQKVENKLKKILESFKNNPNKKTKKKLKKDFEKLLKKKDIIELFIDLVDEIKGAL